MYSGRLGTVEGIRRVTALSVRGPAGGCCGSAATWADRLADALDS
jgi:hypothetical protein